MCYSVNTSHVRAHRAGRAKDQGFDEPVEEGETLCHLGKAGDLATHAWEGRHPLPQGGIQSLGGRFLGAGPNPIAHAGLSWDPPS